MIDREKLLRDLSMNVLDISFIKVNGDNRHMKATLMPQYLPAGTDMRHLKEMHLKPENAGKVVCWEVTTSAWKSFHVDSVTYLQVVDS